MNTVSVVIIAAIGFAYVLCSPVLHRAKRWEQPNYPEFVINFDCYGKPVGFYADVEHNCQVFHMCDADGVRVPHICPNETAFNQQYRVCDWAYNVDCNDAPNWYYLNDLTYVTEPPFDDY